MRYFLPILLVNIVLFLVGSTSSVYPNQQTNVSSETLSLEWVKKPDWSLKNHFLAQLAQLFGTTIFIETGTFHGATTQVALPSFDEIHTIELGKDLYLQAKNKFKNTNVNLYLGDSSSVFPELLPKIKGKVLFWLDGHYSEGNTAKGICNTPVMQELEVIANSSLESPVILIDDIRCFGSLPVIPSLEGYPSVKDLKDAVKRIHPDYEFKILGDIAIAYLPQENVIVSPVIDALTVSRLFENDPTKLEIVFQAEKIIGHAQKKEALAIKLLNSKLSNQHSQLWAGLISANENNHKLACRQFSKAKELGLTHWRVSWYLACSANQSNRIEMAKKALDLVIKENPDFDQAFELLEKINKKKCSI